MKNKKKEPRNYLNANVTEKKFINSELGHGMFATRFIPAGSIILEYSQEVTYDAGAEDSIIDEYSVKRDITGSKHIRPADVTQPGAHIINHSCKPNCNFTPHRVPYDRVFIMTNRDIVKDEELTIYYGWVKDPPIKCMCKIKGCIGTIGHLKNYPNIQEFSNALNQSINVLENAEMTASLIYRFEIWDNLPDYISWHTFKRFEKQSQNIVNLHKSAGGLLAGSK